MLNNSTQVALGRNVLALDPHNAPPPDWRWRLGCYLAHDASLVPAEWVDSWVQLAASLTKCRQERREGANKTIAEMPAGALSTLAIREARPSFVRWELEARLLAGESFVAIAEKCGTQLETVETYHELFFCVRPALHAVGYIFGVAIPPKVHSDLSADDVELLLKVYGYNCGPVFLDAMVEYYQDPPVVPARLDELGPEALLRLTNKLCIRAVILVRTLPNDRWQSKRMAILEKASEVLHAHGLNDRTATMICTAFGVKRYSAESETAASKPASTNVGQSQLTAKDSTSSAAMPPAAAKVA